MALPAARYPDRPLVEEVAVQRPILAAQRFIKPQLLKIPRRVWDPSIPATPIGGGFAKSIITVPDGEIWLIHLLHLRYTASATVNARSVELTLSTPAIASAGSALNPWRSKNVAPAATQVGNIFVSDRFGMQDTGAVVDNVAIREPWPIFPLPPGWIIGIQEFSSTDAADTFTLNGAIERLMTRGLAKEEIPMGLESGFMWDLADVRKVAED